MILAVLLDGDGRPVCTEMWPGNTADAGSLIPVVDRLRKRFSVRRVCVVADRGMISAETIAELEARGLLYILGVRERTDKLVRDLVLDDPAPFVPLVLTKRNKDIEYEAKAVALAGRRYIVCRNREEMKKDAAARAAILAALERQLKKGDKSLVGNKGRPNASPKRSSSDAPWRSLTTRSARTAAARRSSGMAETAPAGNASANSRPKTARGAVGPSMRSAARPSRG